MLHLIRVIITKRKRNLSAACERPFYKYDIQLCTSSPPSATCIVHIPPLITHSHSPASPAHTQPIPMLNLTLIPTHLPPLSPSPPYTHPLTLRWTCSLSASTSRSSRSCENVQSSPLVHLPNKWKRQSSCVRWRVVRACVSK